MALAGAIADPGEFNDGIRKLVARARRETSTSTTTTSEISVMRLDGIVVKGGRSYEFKVSSALLVSSVAADLIAVRLRYATASATATTASTEMLYSAHGVSVASNGETHDLAVAYHPASDDVLSVLLTVVRASGTGNVSMAGGSNTPIELLVWDAGVDPGNTGITL